MSTLSRALLLLVILCGCSSLFSSSSLVGTWECRDLHSVESVALYKSDTLIIKDDGTYVEFLTDANGTMGRPDSGRYKIDSGKIEFGGKGSWYTFKASHSSLTLTLQKSSNAADAGRSLTYTRVK
jgi:hypothetical protein